ncbi:hydroxyisourate hydrolase [Sporolactobacillus sp. THM7-4]|nr:hydroxyisourate hydrolase [Sporolactobacillus sp. THM7-4]
MGRLTTHILDLSKGRPAGKVRIDIYEVKGDTLERMKSDETNDDGRLDTPLISGGTFHPGTYELHFHIGEYFRTQDVQINRLFLDIVVVRFVIDHADENYHVPLLVSPWGYQVYRGS